MKLKQILINLCRIAVGVLFTFSGFVKSVDPVGSAIKFEEYFNAFSLGFLVPFANVFSVLLCGTELMIGLLLIFGLFKYFISKLAMLFMIFFTILTVIIYFNNPVSDCGCFGDAITLTNGQTLLKNIIFTAVLTPFFIDNFKKCNAEKSLLRSILSGIIILISFALPAYSITHIPFIDFLPYKIGLNIPEAMTIPEGAQQSEYETVLVYKDKNSGDIVDFTLSDTTWYDTSRWEFVDSKTITIKEGYEPIISSFDIFDLNSNSVSKTIFDMPDVNLVVLRDIKLTELELRKLKSIDNRYILTHMDINLVKDILDEENVLNMDEKLIKSIIRSNHGVIKLSKGTIKSKKRLKDL